GRDQVRLKIWDRTTGRVLYDTQFGDLDDAMPVTVLTSGDVQINVPHQEGDDDCEAPFPVPAGALRSSPVGVRPAARLPLPVAGRRASTDLIDRLFASVGREGWFGLL